MLWKSIKRNLKKLLHPQSVNLIRTDGMVISEEVAKATTLYLVTYIALLLISWLIISFDGMSIETNLSAVFACLNNIGPGLSMVGPAENFGVFSDFSKYILMFDMLAGRLELLPMIVLFAPMTWKRTK